MFRTYCKKLYWRGRITEGSDEAQLDDQVGRNGEQNRNENESNPKAAPERTLVRIAHPHLTQHLARAMSHQRRKQPRRYDGGKGAAHAKDDAHVDGHCGDHGGQQRGEEHYAHFFAIQTEPGNGKAGIGKVEDDAQIPLANHVEENKVGRRRNDWVGRQKETHRRGLDQLAVVLECHFKTS